MPNMIFISYNRKDEKWVDLFERALKLGVTRNLYTTWTDRQIAPGEPWEPKIMEKIASATIALVLVTPELFESGFVLNEELPALFDRHSKKALNLQWVPIKKVEPWKLKGLQRIQALWRANRPLAEIENADDQRQAVEKICADLIKLLDFNTSEIGELESELKATLGNNVVLREQIAIGDGSVIYRAKEDGEDIAVKVALPSMRRDWVGRDFVDRAKRLQNFVEPGFVRVRKSYSQGRINCVAMDYAGRSSLKNVIQESGTPGLEPLLVANVLAQVTQAADNLHLEFADPDNEFAPLLVGPLRSSHVYRNPKNGKYQISPMQMSQATMQSGRARPMTVLQEDELTWLSPEQYAGERLQAATDQYYIGLLGLELLTGAPPVPVRSYADLDKKRTFFTAPMAGFEKHRKESPALFFVLARMLERRPEDRWPSMADAHRALKKIAEGSVPEEVRSKTRESWKLQDSAFYRNFYAELFRAAPDVQHLFRDINMDEQYEKLRATVGKLLSFRPTDYPNSMLPYAASHERLGLQPKHFEDFRDAFLTALSSQEKSDNYAIDAWRAIFDAGIAYMTTKRAAGPFKYSARPIRTAITSLGAPDLLRAQSN
jgi:hemoglobin-like flavoprotein